MIINWQNEENWSHKYKQIDCPWPIISNINYTLLCMIWNCEVHLLLICRSIVIKFKIVSKMTLSKNSTTFRCVVNNSDILKTFTLHYAITQKAVQKPTEGQRFHIQPQDILTHMACKPNQLIDMLFEWCVFLVDWKTKYKRTIATRKNFSFSSNQPHTVGSFFHRFWQLKWRGCFWSDSR